MKSMTRQNNHQNADKNLVDKLCNKLQKTRTYGLLILLYTRINKFERSAAQRSAAQRSAAQRGI
jgi:hypothetical protein